MPNHEENYVIITGDVEQLKQIFAKLIRPVTKEEQEQGWDNIIPPQDAEEQASPRTIDFNGIVPEPADVNDENPEGWYSWRLEHWATKWNAYGQEEARLIAEVDKDWDTPRIELKFNTAWSQPRGVLEAIDNEFDEVEVHCLTIDEGGYPDVEYGRPWLYLSQERNIYFGEA